MRRLGITDTTNLGETDERIVFMDVNELLLTWSFRLILGHVKGMLNE